MLVLPFGIVGADFSLFHGVLIAHFLVTPFSRDIGEVLKSGILASVTKTLSSELKTFDIPSWLQIEPQCALRIGAQYKNFLLPFELDIFR